MGLTCRNNLLSAHPMAFPDYGRLLLFFPVSRRNIWSQARLFTALVDMTNVTDGTAFFMNCPHRQGNLIPKLWLISSFFQCWFSHYVLTS